MSNQLQISINSHGLIDTVQQSRISFPRYEVKGLRIYSQKFSFANHCQACSQNCEKRTLAFSRVRQSVHVEQLCCHWADFHEILYLNVFSKICRENSSVVKICLTCILFTIMTISRRIILRMINILDKSCRENQNTHFMYNNFFFPENRTIY